MKPLFMPGVLIAVGVLSLGLPTSVRAQEQDSLLVQRERAQWDALKARDTTAFARLMGGDLVDIDVSGIKRTSPASTARYVLGCQTASYALSDVRIARVSGSAVVTYKATVEATCWGQKAPSPLYVMTVYNQRGDAWVPVAHSETPAAHWY
jgi:hypothetical protein